MPSSCPPHTLFMPLHAVLMPYVALLMSSSCPPLPISCPLLPFSCPSHALIMPLAPSSCPLQVFLRPCLLKKRIHIQTGNSKTNADVTLNNVNKVHRMRHNSNICSFFHLFCWTTNSGCERIVL